MLIDFRINQQNLNNRFYSNMFKYLNKYLNVWMKQFEKSLSNKTLQNVKQS